MPTLLENPVGKVRERVAVAVVMWRRRRRRRRRRR
jgi:hypothetical protein